MTRHYVSDAGPLISYEKIAGGFTLLHKLVDRIFIPPQVYVELCAGLRNGGSYLDHHGLADLLTVAAAPIPPPETLELLHSGECHAIALALDRQLPILIDERQGRLVARSVGLAISGSVGILLAGWNDRIITTAEARHTLHALYDAERINRGLLDMTIAHLNCS